MLQPLRILSVVLLVYWACGASAGQITYDFGFNGEQNGFSGTGYFTISELVGAPGLDAFQFSGDCGPSPCYLGLGEISTATWSVNPAGLISDLSILAEYLYFDYGSLTAELWSLSLQLDHLSVSYECGTVIGPGSAASCGEEDRLSTYASGGAFLTLRDELTPTPIPSTLVLFGLGLAGLHLFRRTRVLNR